jgi:predicted metalloprotease with PDZ domain
VSAAAGGKSFADFDARYIEGRDPYPWSTVLPLAGLILRADTVRAPALGVAYEHDSIGAIIIASVDPGSMAAEAGIRPGDRLVAVGDIAATDRGFLGGAMSRYQTAGETVVLKVRRGASTLSLPARVQIRERVTATVAADPRASAKAAAIRTGLMRP